MSESGSDDDARQDDDALQGQEDQEQQQQPRVAARNFQRIQLQEFLHLLAGAHVEREHGAGSNEQLVEHLWRSGSLRTPEVKRAMLACSRDIFVPEPYREEAFLDTPLRVVEMGFNISAPHIHATALEALELRPGDRFLDVGCGCGIVAAAAAQLVGHSGTVNAIDILPAALHLSKSNVTTLRERDSMYAEAACPITWDLQNVFLPTERHTGRYNKIYVGAACPKRHVRLIAKLFCREGGLMLVPVHSELLLLKCLPDGRLGKRVISAVRFTDLEVPRDVDIVLAALQEERGRLRHVDVPPSSLAVDLGGLGPAVGSSSSSGGGGVGAGDTAVDVDGTVDVAVGQAVGEAAAKRAKHDLERRPSYITPQLAALGQPDCYIYGWTVADTAAGAVVNGGGEADEEPRWRLPAHRAVLSARCDLLRAQGASGMRDAHDPAVAAPDGCPAAAVRAMLHYAYRDAGVDHLPPDKVAEVLHVAVFYGCERLVRLCEARLAEALSGPGEGTEEVAPQVLALAQEAALPRLKQAALSYIVEHYEAVRKCESYQALPRALADDVASHACDQATKVLTLLSGLSGGDGSAVSGSGGADDDDI